MSLGINQFLGQAGRNLVVITTLAPQESRIVGTVESLQDDVVVLRRQGNDNLICISVSAIATIEVEPPTDL